MSFGLETLRQSNLQTVSKNFAQVAEYEGAIANPAGLDLEKVVAHRRDTGSILGYPGAENLAGSADLWTMLGADHGPPLRQPAFATAVLDFFFARCHRDLISQLGQSLDGMQPVWGIRIEKHIAYVMNPFASFLGIEGGLGQHSPYADAIFGLLSVLLAFLVKLLFDIVRIIQRQ